MVEQRADTVFMRNFLRSRKMLAGFIFSLVRDADAAEDIFQEVSLVALERYSSFREGTDFGAWVREIARRRVRKAWDELRRRSPVMLDPEAIDAVAVAYEGRAENNWDTREKALDKCLDKLTERARRIVEWRYRQSMAFEKIASELGSTANSVQVTLTRARKALRRCIEATAAGAV